jgi:hypothetical protein
MSVDLHEEVGGKVLFIKVVGELTTQDYEHFIPDVERLIEQHGKIRIVVQMHDFQGWSAGGLWQDIKFDLKHFRDIERLAEVGERAWEHGMAAFCKPFTTARVQYFDPRDVLKAEAWIQADLPIAQESATRCKDEEHAGLSGNGGCPWVPCV